MRSTSRAVSVVLALALSVFFAGAAYAAPPHSAPQQVLATGFESGDPTIGVFALPIQGASAYWGTSGAVFRSGAMGLWCAGTDVSSGGPGTFWPTYPAWTAGGADLLLPELEEFFSSSVSFWHLTPSMGPDDRFTVSAGQLGDDGEPVLPGYIQGDTVAASANWVRRTYDFGSSGAPAASRKPLIVRFAFIDSMEFAPSGTRGQGPAIDDILVTGYKYGPVENIEAVWSDAQGGVALSWQPPAESAVSAADESRPVVYRVWRSLRGADQWTELTAGSPASTTSLIDRDAQLALVYDYVVQAWDVDGISRHGAQSFPVRVATPGAPEPPVANGDAYAVDYGRALSVSAPGVLGNDSSQVSMSAALGTAPSHGTVALQPDGSFVYTPSSGWSGTDSFSYRAISRSVYSEPATVSVLVRPKPVPAATTVVVSSASKTLSKYGAAYSLTGRLESAGKPVPGRTVLLETASSSTGPFSVSGISAETAVDGSFSLRHLPRSKTFYRVRFAGQTGVFLGATSAIRAATPRAYVRTPIAPLTMRAGRAATIYGYLKPRHASGSYPVRIYRYRDVGGKWKSYGYVKAKASAYSRYTKYTAKVKLPYRGRWRLRAYHPTDSGHAASWSSGFDYVTVK